MKTLLRSYCTLHVSTCTTFLLRPTFIYSLSMLHSFNICCFLCFSIVFSGLQNQKGKLIFRYIVIIHGWHAVSSVAQIFQTVSRQRFEKQVITNPASIGFQNWGFSTNFFTLTFLRVYSYLLNIIKPRKEGFPA